MNVSKFKLTDVSLLIHLDLELPEKNENIRIYYDIFFYCHEIFTIS